MTAPMDPAGDGTGAAGAAEAAMAVAAAAESLAAEAGLDAVALGERAVERAVRARLVATGLTPAKWAERLRRDQPERTALIDAVVVPETMLFRDGSPFEALRAMALARTAPARRMRVLSAACSTGEEAYSAAIALLAGGLPPGSVEVVGLDVSAAALTTAAAGVLSRTALRGTIPAWAERYLERRVDGGVGVAPAARARVTFAQANLLTPPAADPFDAILCRNLLIYLTPPARARVTGWLGTQLAPGAPLFVGHAEVAVLLEAGWRRSAGHGPYALEPVGVPEAPADRSLRPTRAIVPAPTAAAPAAARSRPADAQAATAPPAPPALPADAPPAALVAPLQPLAPGPSDDRRAAAVALAEAGERETAIAALLDLVRDEPADVEAHALLGILQATAGRPDAARASLRRALYLDPDHAESRAQLTLLDAAPPAPSATTPGRRA